MQFIDGPRGIKSDLVQVLVTTLDGRWRILQEVMTCLTAGISFLRLTFSYNDL